MLRLAVRASVAFLVLGSVIMVCRQMPWSECRRVIADQVVLWKVRREGWTPELRAEASGLYADHVEKQLRRDMQLAATQGSRLKDKASRLGDARRAQETKATRCIALATELRDLCQASENSNGEIVWRGRRYQNGEVEAQIRLLLSQARAFRANLAYSQTLYEELTATSQEMNVRQNVLEGKLDCLPAQKTLLEARETEFVSVGAAEQLVDQLNGPTHGAVRPLSEL